MFRNINKPIIQTKCSFYVNKDNNKNLIIYGYYIGKGRG